MMPEENEVSLIVESDYPSAFVLWFLREKGRKESGHPPSDISVEIIEDDFREVVCRISMVINI
jgi:hypothetical protein